MSTETLDLGISQEELREQIIDRAATKLAKYLAKQDDTFQPIRDVATEVVSEVASRIADEEVRPWVEQQIEAVILQRTNEWGEAKGDPATFRQYLVERAEKYLTEKVDHEGNTRDESRFSSWRANTTRVMYLVDKHLQYHIETAMKKALETANSHIVGGINEAVRMKLAEVSESLKVTVAHRR